MPTGNGQIEVVFRLTDGTEITSIEDVTNVLTFLEDHQEYVKVRHGRWKPFDLTWGRSVYACTNCGEAFEVPTESDKPMYDYCPNCGARMDL